MRKITWNKDVDEELDDVEYIPRVRDDDDSEQHQPTRKEKREQKRLQKQRKKEERLFKKIKNFKKKTSFGPMFGVMGTVFLMVVVLFVYSFAYLIAPSYTLMAEVRVTKGGFDLVYPICTVPLSYLPENIEEGDVINLNMQGRTESLSRNTMRMQVDEIKDGVAKLSFVAKGVPDFLSNEEFQGLLQFDQNATSQYRYVYITGRVVGNRFSILKISLKRS